MTGFERHAPGSIPAHLRRGWGLLLTLALPWGPSPVPAAAPRSGDPMGTYRATGTNFWIRFPVSTSVV
jgi:hypothetical protein